MMELARSHDDEPIEPNKGNLRATGESKISNNPQVPELQELMDVILADKEKTERAGFEPPVLVTSTLVFETSSISRSDTSPSSFIYNDLC